MSKTFDEMDTTSSLLREQENIWSEQRVRLRDFAVSLREPGQAYARSPASREQPVFLIGANPGIEAAGYKPEPGMAVDARRGQMSEDGFETVLKHIRYAGILQDRGDIRGRDQQTARAAQASAQDYLRSKGFNATGEDVARGFIERLRAQASFHIRNLASQAGLSGVSAQAVAYSFERALQTQAFRSVSNKAVDLVAGAADKATGRTQPGATVRETHSELDNGRREQTSDATRNSSQARSSPVDSVQKEEDLRRASGSAEPTGARSQSPPDRAVREAPRAAAELPTSKSGQVASAVGTDNKTLPQAGSAGSREPDRLKNLPETAPMQASRAAPEARPAQTSVPRAGLDPKPETPPSPVARPDRLAASRAILERNAAPETFRASGSAATASLGWRANMDRTLNDSMSWLSKNGVSRDAIKGALNRHAGKIMVAVDIAQNPDLVKKTAQMVANSDSVIDGVVKAATDKEVRHAVGTLTMATGESVAAVPGARAAGSLAVVGGSMLRGDTSEQTARHAVRAGFALLGGAMGGAAGVSMGPAAIATAVVGAELGAHLGDKVLAVWDRFQGNTPEQTNTRTISQEQIEQSAKVLADKGVGLGQDGLSKDLADPATATKTLETPGIQPGLDAKGNDPRLAAGRSGFDFFREQAAQTQGAPGAMDKSAQLDRDRSMSYGR